MRRPVLIAILVIAAVALVLATAGGGRDTSLERVRERGTLRVGMDASFPPFEVVDASGELRGLDVDLARLLAQEMELKLDIANIAFDGLYDALACGEVDVLISALPYDPLRTQDVTYSPPYAVDGLAWLYREGSSAQDPDTFRGEILAEAGSEAAYLGRERWPEARVVEVPSEAEVVARLRAGAEAGLTTRVSACTLGLPGDGIALGPLFNEVPYSVAVRASNAALAQAVMDALGQVLAGEEWRMAVDSWLGEGC